MGVPQQLLGVLQQLINVSTAQAVRSTVAADGSTTAAYGSSAAAHGTGQQLIVGSTAAVGNFSHVTSFQRGYEVEITLRHRLTSIQRRINVVFPTSF